MKKIHALIAAVVVLAAASVAVIVNAGKPDSFFDANVEALADTEDNGNCSFQTVIKREASHTLICRGLGSLCCEW